MIVKVQLPLFSSEKNPPALIYNKDRKIYATVPVTEEVVELMGDSAKEFFHAEIEDGNIVLGDKAPWQKW